MKEEKRLPIGSKVTLKDNEEDFAEDAGKTKTITGYRSYCGDDVGYELDGDKGGIFLDEDFK